MLILEYKLQSTWKRGLNNFILFSFLPLEPFFAFVLTHIMLMGMSVTPFSYCKKWRTELPCPGPSNLFSPSHYFPSFKSSGCPPGEAVEPRLEAETETGMSEES